MASRNYQITVTKPCSENWEGMNPSGEGRFCDHCSKQVLDLSSMTDEDILRLIRETKGEVCGRVQTERLNQPIRIGDPAPESVLMRQAAAGLLILGLSSTQVQAGNGKAGMGIHTSTSTGEVGKPVQRQNRIAGILLEATTNDPIPFALLHVRNSELAATTDVDGRFSLDVPGNLRSDSIVVEVAYMGYLKAEFVFYPKELPVFRTLTLHRDRSAPTQEVKAISMGKMLATDHVQTSADTPRVVQKLHLEGTLIQEGTREVLPYATIALKNLNLGTVTDSNGHFRLDIPDNFSGDSVLLETVYIGYERKQFAFHRNQFPVNQVLSVKLSLVMYTVGGIGAVETVPGRYRKRIRDFFRFRKRSSSQND